MVDDSVWRGVCEGWDGGFCLCGGVVMLKDLPGFVSRGQPLDMGRRPDLHLWPRRGLSRDAMAYAHTIRALDPLFRRLGRWMHWGWRGMRRFAALVLIGVGVVAAGCGEPRAPVATPVVFIDVTVLPMTEPGARLPGHTVVVRNGVIERVGPSSAAPLPQGAQIIQGGGRYLMPGLVDMHVRTDPDAPDMPALFIGHGVTTVREMSASMAHVELRQRIADGVTLGPSMVLVPDAVSGGASGSPSGGPSDSFSDSFSGAMAGGNGSDAHQVFYALGMARALLDQGFTRLGLGVGQADGLGGAAFWRVFAHARDRGADVAVGTPVAVPVERVLRAGPNTLEGLSGYGFALARLQGLPLGAGVDEREAWAVVGDAHWGAQGRGAALARMTARYGVANCPSLWWSTGVSARAAGRGRGAGRYVSAARRSVWAGARSDLAVWVERDAAAGPARSAMVGALYEAGAIVLACSRAGAAFALPGQALHDEMDALHAAGMPAEAVLLGATRDAASVLNQDGAFGVVAVGARADLILLDHDPTVDLGSLRRPDGVMVRGVWFDRSALARLMASVASDG